MKELNKINNIDYDSEDENENKEIENKNIKNFD